MEELGLDACVQSREVVRILRVGDGFLACLYTQDEMRLVLASQGRSVEEAVRRLDAACRTQAVYRKLFRGTDARA